MVDDWEGSTLRRLLFNIVDDPVAERSQPVASNFPAVESLVAESVSVLPRHRPGRRFSPTFDTGTHFQTRFNVVDDQTSPFFDREASAGLVAAFTTKCLKSSLTYDYCGDCTKRMASISVNLPTCMFAPPSINN